MKKLIINADDYGHSSGVSAGIREAYSHGVVSSTTAMMNMDHVEAELENVQKSCPDLGLGVHLNVTTGKPILPISQISTLVDENGIFHSDEYYILHLESINPEHVALEWEAQIKKFISAAGKNPDHLDAHHHLAFFSKDLFRIYLAYAEKYSCAIRFAGGKTGADLISDFSEKHQAETKRGIAEMSSKSTVWHPDYFIRSFYGNNSTKEFLLKVLDNLEPGVTEMMCHPGYCDATLKTMSVYTVERERELRIFMDPDIRSFMENHQIELTDFKKESRYSKTC